MLAKTEKKKSQREIYTDGHTVGQLDPALMGLFLVWMGVSFSVGFPWPVISSILSHSMASICLYEFTVQL